METKTPHGHRYFVLHLDEASHQVLVNLMKVKSESAQHTKDFDARAEARTGQRGEYFRSDGGGEYESKGFQAWLRQKGIHHEKSNAYTPQENGKAERMVHTIVEMARSLLNEAKLPKTYWGYAVLYAAHILNLLPTRTLDGKTPHEAYTGNKPSVAHLRIFGCKVHVHVPDEKCRKLNLKSFEGVFLGYAEHRKSYVVLDKQSKRIYESRDVGFDEGLDSSTDRVVIDPDDTFDTPSSLASRW